MLHVYECLKDLYGREEGGEETAVWVLDPRATFLLPQESGVASSADWAKKLLTVFIYTLEIINNPNCTHLILKKLLSSQFTQTGVLLFPLSYVIVTDTSLHEMYIAQCRELTWHTWPHSGPSTPHSGFRFQRRRRRKMIICVIALFAAAKVGHKFGGTKTVRCRCWVPQIAI